MSDPSIDTLAELRRIFRYDPISGKLYRRVILHRWGTKCIPEEEISKVSGIDGYLRVMHKRQHYLVHRLAWAIMYGTWPNIIDHKNGDKTDNRLDNLRDCNHSINAHNAKRQINKTTGYTGVTCRKDKFVARINQDYIQYHIGVYDSLEEAAAAYAKAKEGLCLR